MGTTYNIKYWTTATDGPSAAGAAAVDRRAAGALRRADVDLAARFRAVAIQRRAGRRVVRRLARHGRRRRSRARAASTSPTAPPTSPSGPVLRAVGLRPGADTARRAPAARRATPHSQRVMQRVGAEQARTSAPIRRRCARTSTASRSTCRRSRRATPSTSSSTSSPTRGIDNAMVELGGEVRGRRPAARRQAVAHRRPGAAAGRRRHRRRSCRWRILHWPRRATSTTSHTVDGVRVHAHHRPPHRPSAALPRRQRDRRRRDLLRRRRRGNGAVRDGARRPATRGASNTTSPRCSWKRLATARRLRCRTTPRYTELVGHE